jgi:surface carbohydrate biosynthesis protein
MLRRILRKNTLLLPIENQVRELDPRLLLAAIAASRGLTAVVGPIREIDRHISAYPGSLYLAKSMLPGRLELFQIMRQLGIVIFALDEEALVHLPPEIYYSRRLCPEAMACVAHLFAWGPDNADLWRRYPDFPSQTTIHLTGNPRNDMLRAEIRGFYEEAVARLRKDFGDFILVNTNFNHVNAFYPRMNLFLPNAGPGETFQFGKAAKGMTFHYAKGLWEHKQAVFRDFQKLIPDLDRAFPNHTIVVRPHPIEDQSVYRSLAAQCKRVRVTNDGNVVPWLMASKLLIHNGCTTGVEAYVIGVPAISYRATVNDAYDEDFYRLPNRLSHQCFNFEELYEKMREILAGPPQQPETDPQKDFIAHHLTALDGPLASQRMVDVFKEISLSHNFQDQPTVMEWLRGTCQTFRLNRKKLHKTGQQESHLKQDFQRHRYPSVSLEEVQRRVGRFQKILGRQKELNVTSIYNQSFRIS